MATLETGSANLPEIWTCLESFASLQRLAAELLGLWKEAGAGEKETNADAEAIVRAALQATERCIKQWQQRCRALAAKCQELVGLIEAKQATLPKGSFAKELAAALKQPWQPRLAALRRLLDTIEGAVEEQDKLRAGLAAACAALGLDPSEVAGMSPEELRAEAARRERELRQRYEETLRAMGLNPDDFPLDGDLASMAQKLKEMEAKLASLKASCLASARRAKEIWEELRESPELPRDSEAVAVAANAPQSVTAATASAVEASLRAWEARRAERAQEAEVLHAAIRGHSTAKVAEEFLAAHGGLHAADLEACRRKLQQLRDECRKAEAPTRQKLRQLYNQTGRDVQELNDLFAAVEEAGTAEQRRRLLEKELRRMHEYAESVGVILGQREELRALVVAGECFERQAQAGAGRWVGNSKHFLEEEKFRRRFVRQYPELRDKMIDSIEAWETAEGKTFLHNGIALGARLREARDHGVALASAQGDLSIMSVLLQILGVTDEQLPISPSARSNDSPTPKAKGKAMARASSEAAIPRRSPSPKRRGIKRQQSAADLTVRLPPIRKV